jgi:PadR family transcriptional regulator PadR
MLGKLEEVIVMATLRTGGNAVPSAIYEKIVASTSPGSKEPAFGAVYTTLTRMAAKRLLTAGTTTDEKGRERKTFTVTAAGQRALQESLHPINALGGHGLVGGFA